MEPTKAREGKVRIRMKNLISLLSGQLFPGGKRGAFFNSVSDQSNCVFTRALLRKILRNIKAQTEAAPAAAVAEATIEGP